MVRFASSIVCCAVIAAGAFADDTVVRRAVVETSSVFMNQDALDSLEAKIMLKATESFGKQSTEAIAAAVQSSIGTSFAYVEPLVQKTDKLSSKVDATASTVNGLKSQISDSLDTKFDTFSGDITKDLNDFKSDSDKALINALASVKKSVDTVTASVGKVRTDADSLACNSGTKGTLRMVKGAVQGCDGAKWNAMGGATTIYTNWGTDTCKGKDKKGVTQLYSGFAWGGYHDHRGGAEPMCLKAGGGRNGAGAYGDDSQNLMYPLRTEGPSPQNGNIQNNRLIRCAVCKIEKHCYLESGINGCGSTEYEAIYSGSYYGGYHDHVSNNGRICLDRVGKYDNSNGFGAYMYPSKIRAGFDGRDDNAFVHCHQCCKK